MIHERRGEREREEGERGGRREREEGGGERERREEERERREERERKRRGGKDTLTSSLPPSSLEHTSPPLTLSPSINVHTQDAEQDDTLDVAGSSCVTFSSMT